jgi:hypothetical protein
MIYTSFLIFKFLKCASNDSTSESPSRCVFSLNTVSIAFFSFKSFLYDLTISKKKGRHFSFIK